MAALRPEERFSVRLLLLSFVCVIASACVHTPPPSPLPRACSLRGDCPADAPLSVCINGCSPRVELGGECTTNPCDPSPRVCDPDKPLACVPSAPGSGIGRCEATGSWTFACIPGDQMSPCTTGFYCLDTNRFAYDGTSPPYNPPPATPVCLPIKKTLGEDCDSNFDRPAGRPCLPGLSCVDGTCQRPCDEDADCPCRPYDFVYRGVAIRGVHQACFPGQHQVFNASTTSVCLDCSPGGLGSSCADTRRCCDNALACGADMRCSKVNGASCSDRSECAGGACVSGACQTCAALGTPPSTGKPEQCCNSGAIVQGGICIMPCLAVKGEPCTATGSAAKGECKKGTVLGCEIDGTVICTPGSPKMETCNSLDDDCNGTNDDIKGTCKVESVMGCQGGFQVDSVNVCSGGMQICKEVAAGTDYCTADNQIVKGQACGTPFGANCGPCAPNLACVQTLNGTRCDRDEKCGAVDRPLCWHPSQIGQCCKDIKNCTP